MLNFHLRGLKTNRNDWKEKKVNSKVYHINRGVEYTVCFLPTCSFNKFNLSGFQSMQTERILTVYPGPSLSVCNTDNDYLMPDAER